MIELVLPDMAVKMHWERGDWPLKGLDENPSFYQEQVHANLEDVRKRLWLHWNYGAGTYDIEKLWGYPIGPVADLNFVPYSPGLWVGLWVGYAAPTLLEPGGLVVLYEWESGKRDLFINNSVMSDNMLDANPPVSNGRISVLWNLSSNPNLYCHADLNAGRDEIGADGRYVIRDHPADYIVCGRDGYTFKSKLHKFYPQQTDPLAQVTPVKDSAGWRQRLDPNVHKLEIKHHHITQAPRTNWHKSKDVIGFEPCVKTRRFSEYVVEAPEPRDGEALIGQAYYRQHLNLSEDTINQFWHDPHMCEAVQDRIIVTCEHQRSFVQPVTDEWILDFARFNNVGTWWIGFGNYYYGQIVWKYNAAGNIELDDFWVCISLHSAAADKEPGTPGGDQYWKSPPWQPLYLKEHADFANMQDSGRGPYQSGFPELDYAHYFCCNGSTFELCLKMIDSFDWWWDKDFPHIPLAFYEEMYSPVVGWPPPARGCWRRTWKYSMGRIKNKDGTDALMWPGEMGYPPGYMLWFGEPTVWFHLIVTQAHYDPVKDDAVYGKYFRVQDVEADYAAAYAQNKAEVDKLLAAHHDPKLIQYRKFTNPTTGDEETKPFPFYEIHHELVNDLRNVLLQLRWFDLPFTASVEGDLWDYEDERTEDHNFTTSLDAHHHWMAYKDIEANKKEAVIGVGYNVYPSLCGQVTWSVGDTYRCFQNWSPAGDRSAWQAPTYRLLFKETYGDFLTDIPPGHLMARVRWCWAGGGLAAAGGVEVGCRVGFGEVYVETIPPDWPTPWVGPSDYRWKYVGMDHARRTVIVEGGIVKRQTEFDAYILTPWVDDSFFDWQGTPSDAKKGWFSGMRLAFDFFELDKPKVFEIDFNGFPDSIFKQDKTNFLLR